MSREAVLGSIRTALRAAGDATRSVAEADHGGAPSLGVDAKIDRMVERLEEYGSRVFRIGADRVPATIAHVLETAAKQRLVVPAGLPESWLVSSAEWVPDEALSYAAIESADGVLTNATAAVADSGSIVLTHGAGQGRRALTLLPDYHLCVLYASQIAETLPQCFGQLDGADRTMMTFISGPSATADIEMTRIKGVHGPRFLDVVLVMDA